MYNIWHGESQNTKNITELINFKSHDGPAAFGYPVQIGDIGPAHLAIFMDKTAVPVGFKYYSPVTKHEFGFRPTNTVKENFPLSRNVKRPYAIRIVGYFGKRYPSRIGTIYFDDWETFYNFSKYIHIGQ